MNYYFLECMREMILFNVSGFQAHIISGIEGIKADTYNMT